jgi:hypothetical protein
VLPAQPPTHRCSIAAQPLLELDDAPVEVEDEEELEAWPELED